MTTKETKAVTRICNLITQMSGDNKKGYLIFCEGMAFEKELVSTNVGEKTNMHTESEVNV